MREINLINAGSEAAIEEVVADKGYHATVNLRICKRIELRTYILELKRKSRRRWQGKPAGTRETVSANRRRVVDARGKRLQRLRSELTERSFAYMFETGDGGRSWLRGLKNESKRYLVQAAARNLGVNPRRLFGMGTPRGLQRGLDPVSGQILALLRLCVATMRAIAPKMTSERPMTSILAFDTPAA